MRNGQVPKCLTADGNCYSIVVPRNHDLELFYEIGQSVDYLGWIEVLALVQTGESINISSQSASFSEIRNLAANDIAQSYPIISC